MTELRLDVDIRAAPADLTVLTGALGPEHVDEFPGVATSLERSGDRTARLTVEGADVPSVRAAMNAHLRWIRTIEDVLAVDPDRRDTEVDDDGRR